MSDAQLIATETVHVLDTRGLRVRLVAGQRVRSDLIAAYVAAVGPGSAAAAGVGNRSLVAAAIEQEKQAAAEKLAAAEALASDGATAAGADDATPADAGSDDPGAEAAPRRRRARRAAQ